MVLYTYTIITTRDEKGTPQHTYEGKRNTAIDGFFDPNKGVEVNNVGSNDKMAKLIAQKHEELMRLNPHITRLEQRVEEIA